MDSFKSNTSKVSRALTKLNLDEDEQDPSASPGRTSFGSADWTTVLASPAQSAFLREVISDHKSNSISLDSHIARERALAQMPHALRSVKRYILVPLSDPEGTDIRSSITLVDSLAFVATPNGETQTVPALYAGTAATPLQFRQKGYALKLLNDLKGLLQPEEGGYTVVQWYSEADGLFARLDPKITESLNCVVDSSLEFASSGLMKNLSDIREEQVGQFLELDKVSLKDEVTKFSREIGKSVICIVPDADCVQYRCAEGRLALTYSKGAPSEPLEDWTICGAHIESSDPVSFILWRLTTKNVNTDKSYLRIIRLRFENIEQLRQLLTAAVKASYKLGCNGNIRWRANLRYKSYIDDLKLIYELAGDNDTVTSRVDFGGCVDKLAQDNMDHEVWSFEQYIMG